jgi:hypothetical protein
MHGDNTEEATVATVDADGGEDSRGIKDIFEDVDVMKYLKEREVKAMWSTKERDQVLQQAKKFVWERTHLLRLWPDGTKKVVPIPEERVKLIKHTHEDLGHFGVRRTYIACFKFSTGDEECNNKFKRWWPDVWFVIVCERLLMLQCHSYNHYQSWDWAIGGV